MPRPSSRQLRQARDDEIRKLRSEGATLREIGRKVGCSVSTVWEVVGDRREAYNARRREHWRVYAERKRETT